MRPAGFQVRQLMVTGVNVPTAELRFQPGLNVITGESNSGKSFILQCLDFMLGAESAPKRIPESQGYTQVTLEIETRDGTPFTLRRSLSGGGFLLYRTRLEGLLGEGRPLSPAHEAGNDNTISAFLLGLCGFSPARLRKNKRNETVNLTWRTLSHLFLFNETRIITLESPVKKERGFGDAVMASVLKFMLTGLDDRDIVAVNDPKITEAQRTAKREVYIELMSTLTKELDRFEKIMREVGTTDLEQRTAAADVALQESSQRLRGIQDRKVESLHERDRVGARLHDVRLSLKRFAILSSHYESDLERLVFLDEGQHYFEQLAPARCPTCLLPLTPEHDHGTPVFATPNYTEAINEEIRKIQVHLAELDDTTDALRAREAELEPQFVGLQQILDSIDAELAAESPSFQALRREVELLVTTQHASQEWERVWQQRATYSSFVNDLGQVVKTPRATPVETLDGITLQPLSEIIEETLVSWAYSQRGRVNFDARMLDFTVDGVARSSNGKGHRAVLNSSFAISLMRYCDRYACPHPGFVIMDSPLTTFREDMKGRTEETGRVHERFFADLAAMAVTEQVIVFENKEAPENLRNSINYIEFSREKLGARRGFFPL